MNTIPRKPASQGPSIPTIPIGRFLVGLCAVALFTVLAAGAVFDPVERMVLDAFFRRRPPLATHPDIVFIEIGEDSLAAIGRWPWPRRYAAVMTHLLSEWGARAVVFDVIFSEASDASEDGALAEALDRHDRVYLPVVRESTASMPTWIHSLPDLERNAKAVGHINVVPDPDGTLRRIAPSLQEGQERHLHLAVKVAYDYLDQEITSLHARPFPTDAEGNLLINWAGRWADTYTHYSFVDVLKSFEAVEHGRQPLIPPAAFKDKICLIGLTATGHADIRVSPMEPVFPAIGIHANVINSILMSRFIAPASPRTRALSLVGLGAITAVLLLVLPPSMATLAGLGVGAAWLLTAFLLFVRQGLWLPVAGPLAPILSQHIASGLFVQIAGEKERFRLFQLATHDGLTGLLTIRYFRQLLAQSIHQAREQRRPVSLLLVDLDHFKQINDTFSHLHGDAVLKIVSKLVVDSVRTRDVVGRYGGEEIVLMLPDTPLGPNTVSGAYFVAERIRLAIEQEFCIFQHPLALTVSVGVSTLHDGETSSEPLIRRADEALYRAKAEGRNRVCVESPPSVVGEGVGQPQKSAWHFVRPRPIIERTV